MKKKYIFNLLVSVVILSMLLLGGCSSKNNSSGGSASEEAADEATEADDEGEEGEAEEAKEGEAADESEGEASEDEAAEGEATEEAAPVDPFTAEVASAYLSYIQDNQEFLDVPYTSWNPDAPAKARQTIDVLDVWGDETPELILAEAMDIDNIYNPLEPLLIWTYENGELVNLFDFPYTCAYTQGDYIYYILLQDPEDKALLFYVSKGHEAGEEIWSKFPTSGNMSKEIIIRNTFTPYGADGQPSNSYTTGSGEPMTEDEYKEWCETLTNKNPHVIFSGELRWFGDPLAMTYDEAVSFLEEKASN